MRDVRPDPALDLAEGFGRSCAAWAAQLGAPAEVCAAVQQAARAVSLATSAGHACAHIDEVASAMQPAQSAGSLRDQLLQSGVVGLAPQAGAVPLVVDVGGRLYLHRYFALEQQLAQRLVRALQQPALQAEPAAMRLLAELYPAGADGAADPQRQAVAQALAGRLTVVSGGPGTGKTTTVVNLLACLLAQQPDLRIALAAPTGKAAARMTEAIRQRAHLLPEALRARLPAESFTVHRLLGATPRPGRFRHHAGNPLALDLLVVDEASMLDLALATRLMDAVPPGARVVLLGDKGQLAAVESGAVFAELSASEGALAGAVALLERNYRFATGSGIGELAQDIKSGRAREALRTLGQGGDPSARWLDLDAAPPAAGWQDAVREGFAGYLQALQDDASDIAGVSGAFDRFRVLCAVRAGQQGVDAVNGLMEAVVRMLPGLSAEPASRVVGPWYVGRPVMVVRNEPSLRLFNGDIGLALPDAEGELKVHFAQAEGHRSIALARMPAHETAFATTVHKAQGSEFDEVLLLLPEQGSRVLTRELVYTGVTRARARVTIAASASASVLAAAIGARTQRHTGLLSRIAEAAAPGTPAGR